MAATCASPTLLTPVGYQSGDCGYCKGSLTSASYYARTKSLCPDHYQELMDRGWRRSGSLLYLPDASRSCCPHYTIRLPAKEFQTTRDQRQALHRWNRFVLGEEYIKQASKKYPKTKAEKKRQNNTFDLLATIHESEQQNLKPDITHAHSFEVTLEPDTFTEEKFGLFEDYQSHVHHEAHGEISRGGFRRFLCSTPLHDHSTAIKKIGSFHQMYRLDGRLIAMSVLDLLPHAVSGVYFIYHSDFEAYSFGKLSALRETAFALEAGYDLYYMGYFIHSCKKMRYKGDYRPQNVLDYDTGEWHVMDDDMTSLMDRRKWVSVSRERGIQQSLAQIESTDDSMSKAEAEEELVTEAYHVEYPHPVAAMNSGLSLLELKVPGALTLEQLREQIDLDDMRISLGVGARHRMRDIVSWAEGSPTDATSIQGLMAELAACLGPKVAKEAVVDLSR